jgi:hypothetical protein
MYAYVANSYSGSPRFSDIKRKCMLSVMRWQAVSLYRWHMKSDYCHNTHPCHGISVWKEREIRGKMAKMLKKDTLRGVYLLIDHTDPDPSWVDKLLFLPYPFFFYTLTFLGYGQTWCINSYLSNLRATSALWNSSRRLLWRLTETMYLISSKRLASEVFD